MDHLAPRRQPLRYRRPEPVVQQQVCQPGIAGVCIRYPVKKAGPNDAAGPPKRRDLTQIHTVTVLLASLPQQRHPLRIGADLACVQCVPRGVDQLLAIAGKRLAIRAGQYCRCRHPLLLQRRDYAARNRAVNRRNRCPHVHCVLACPFAGALLLRFVEHHINQRAAALFVHPPEYPARDIDQKAVQFPPVPLVKHFRQLTGVQPQNLPQNVIRLGNKLHVPIFDAVVHHLYIVARAPAPDVADTWLAVLFRFGGDRPQHRADRFPPLRCPAWHDRGTPERAFLPAADADSHIDQSLRRQRLAASLGVRKVTVAAVHHDIALVQQRDKSVQHRIDRLARLHHQQHPPRPRQFRHHLLQRHRGYQILAVIIGHKIGHFGCGAIVNNNIVAVALQI